MPESFAVEFKVSYRLGTTHSEVPLSLLGASGVRTTLPKIPSASLIEDILGGSGGAITNPSVAALPVGAGGLIEGPKGDIYDRIWVIPGFLRPVNPALGVDIPFTIWMAYTVANSWSSTGGTGQTGLTLDSNPVRAFFAVEELVVNLQIGPTAPTEISALFIFNFTLGSGEFIFETVVADWIRFIPELPVLERWGWLSTVVTGYNGSAEQRMSIRRQPRRRLEARLILEDDAARQQEYDRWYNRLGANVVVPFYQYATLITVGSAVSTSELFFTPALTDFRDDELAVVFRPSTEESFLITLGSLTATGAMTASPITNEIVVGDIITPGFASRLDNRTGPSMRTVAGQIVIQALVEDFRSTFNRPGSAAVIDTFDGLNVLDKRPLASQDVPEIFNINPVLVESPAGRHDIRTHWNHPFVSGGRQYKIARRLDPVQMDYWRDFITATRGQREPFLTPTFREDLFLSGTPNPGDPSFLIDSDNYASAYFPYDTYTRLRLENPNGNVEYRKVIGAIPQPGATVLLTLDSPLPVASNWGIGFKIGYLNRVRLGSDEVTLVHEAMDTFIEIVLRTTDT